jgi:phospholipid/cholesterol/gamma-HCH transport system ATP-binding protein
MSGESIIEIRNFAASFGATKVLTDVNCHIYRGDVTIILGSSGSGKSTLLKHMLGLYPLRHGSIKILGKEISELSEEEELELYLKMGVFYQNGALLNSLTVSENIALPLKQHKKLPERLVNDIVMMKLGLVNLLYAKDYYPSELSGGMLKRAALARAIVMDPPVLFLDEPGAGLDPISMAALDKLILNLKNQLGISIVMVTHEVTSIMRIADRVIYIHDGVVVYEGTLKDAIRSGVEEVRNFFSVIDDVEKITQS